MKKKNKEYSTVMNKRGSNGAVSGFHSSMKSSAPGFALPIYPPSLRLLLISNLFSSIAHANLIEISSIWNWNRALWRSGRVGGTGRSLVGGELVRIREELGFGFMVVVLRSRDCFWVADRFSKGLDPCRRLSMLIRLGSCLVIWCSSSSSFVEKNIYFF